MIKSELTSGFSSILADIGLSPLNELQCNFNKFLILNEYAVCEFEGKEKKKKKYWKKNFDINIYILLGRTYLHLILQWLIQHSAQMRNENLCWARDRVKPYKLGLLWGRSCCFLLYTFFYTHSNSLYCVKYQFRCFYDSGKIRIQWKESRKNKSDVFFIQEQNSVNYMNYSNWQDSLLC